jgi:hypothetical protein
MSLAKHSIAMIVRYKSSQPWSSIPAAVGTSLTLLMILELDLDLEGSCSPAFPRRLVSIPPPCLHFAPPLAPALAITNANDKLAVRSSLYHCMPGIIMTTVE